MTAVAALDTTVLVAGLVVAHPGHAACRPYLERAHRMPGSLRCSWHAIAESFRVLASLPIQPAMRAEDARTVVNQMLIPRLDPLPLTAGDYERAMELVCASGLGAGAVYDALHLVAAVRMGATALITANTRHFTSLAKSGGIRISVVDPAAAASAQPRQP